MRTHSLADDSTRPLTIIPVGRFDHMYMHTYIDVHVYMRAYIQSYFHIYIYIHIYIHRDRERTRSYLHVYKCRHEYDAGIWVDNNEMIATICPSHR